MERRPRCFYEYLAPLREDSVFGAMGTIVRLDGSLPEICRHNSGEMLAWLYMRAKASIVNAAFFRFIEARDARREGRA